MTEQLNNLIKTGPITRAQRIVIHGPNGIGKTTLAAQFPDPLILDAEDGSTHQNLARIQTPTEASFFEALRTLSGEENTYQTLVIDTIDVAEKFNRERVLKRHKMKNIEDFGYGKGWTYLREEFDLFLSGCLDTFIRHGIHVVSIGHSTVKRIKPPGLSDAYDRYELKLDPVNAARLREWADAVLFINWDVRISENAEGRVRGVGGKERLAFTTHCAAFDAKNRVNLPEKLECKFTALAPLLGDTDASDSQPEPSEGQLAKQSKPRAAAVVPAAGVVVPLEISPQDNGAETPQQRLAAALNDVDAELVRLFLLNRKVCADGLIQSVPDDYANRALAHLPRFRERLTKFEKEPF
jgi:AAA domain